VNKYYVKIFDKRIINASEMSMVAVAAVYFLLPSRRGSGSFQKKI
jgi:hypothetical protein